MDVGELCDTADASHHHRTPNISLPNAPFNVRIEEQSEKREKTYLAMRLV
jgi:hypothetical protein